ncbi:MAG TPA: hypothetical protein VFU54_09960 [Actinomycetota bacterium]|nr:hypothetical protein [Actinomycetota bacterium]
MVADTSVDFDDNDTFDQAVEAATTLDAAEAFLTGRPLAARAELIRPGDGRYRVTGMAPRPPSPTGARERRSAKRRRSSGWPVSQDGMLAMKTPGRRPAILVDHEAARFWVAGWRPWPGSPAVRRCRTAGRTGRGERTGPRRFRRRRAGGSGNGG